MALTMANPHDRAVKKLAHRYRSQSNTKKVYAHRIARFDDPHVRVGSEDFIPDIVIKYTNGREKLIEVDSKPLRSKDRRQHNAFKRSADRVPNRTYERRFTQNIL